MCNFGKNCEKLRRKSLILSFEKTRALIKNPVFEAVAISLL